VLEGRVGMIEAAIVVELMESESEKRCVLEVFW
jgi:hypothetical protein